MYWASGYDKLTQSGLPYGWAAVLIGRQFGKVSDEDVAAFALTLIGSASDEQDRIAALLVNTDPQHWQTINRYLEELAFNEIMDRQPCLRLWRYADLKHVLETASPSDKAYTDDEWCPLGYALVDVLSDYDDLPGNAAPEPRWGERPGELMRQYQQWLAQEAALLTSLQ